MKFAGDYGIPIDQIRRYPFFNIGSSDGALRWLIAVLAVAAFLFLANIVIQRVKMWRQGRGELRTDYPEKRLLLLFKLIISHSRILDNRYAGIMHCLIFYGFTVLFLACLVIMFEQNITGPVFGNFFIHGNFYLILSFLADFAGLAILAGIILAVFRRYISKPISLSASKSHTFALLFLLFIVVSGFLTEGLRIAATGFPEFERWSFAGWAAAAPFSLISEDFLPPLQRGIWWLHMACGFAFTALMATGKLGHIIISPINIYYSNLSDKNLATKYSMPLNAEYKGSSAARDFTWKSLLDSDACTHCGRCQDNCPAWITEAPLSPKSFILSIKNCMEQNPAGPVAVESGALWACMNCAACMEACPVLIEHLPKILEMKRYKVLADNDIPYELGTIFENTAAKGNPLGLDGDVLQPWLGSLRPSGAMAASADAGEYFYFTGSSVYDEDAREVSSCFMSILNKAGISAGLIGGRDSGDLALRCGNEPLFRVLAAGNIALFNEYGVKKIICTSPHDYNVFKKEYVSFAKSGGINYDVQVFHHTHIIHELLETGRIVLKDSLDETVVYHDSCFLGRYNGIYSEPRSILASIDGLHLVEMERSGRFSFCCGAGGGAGFLPSIDSSISIKAFRAKDAQFSGASVVCTACPFCRKAITEGMAAMNIKNIKTADIAELVCGLIK
jgi:Fe-S oxidoreductase/nitrate reductase gamma subunit